MIPEAAGPLCADWLKSLQVLLGDALVGFYLYGALTFPDSGPVKDVDYHVFLTRLLSDGERVAIDGLHNRLAVDYPPLGGETDGYYITLSDAQSLASPRTQMWPLRRLPTFAADAAPTSHRANEYIWLWC